MQGRFESSSGAGELLAESAEEVGSERHEGGDRRDAEREVELELHHWAKGAVTLSPLSLSLSSGHGNRGRGGLGSFSGKGARTVGEKMGLGEEKWKWSFFEKEP